MVSTASEYGLEMPIVRAAREVNQNQRERVIEKLLGEIRILKGRTIGLLGLAFKPNTDDLRDAPAIDIARKLLDRGARVKVHDPVASDRFRAEYSDLNVICCETPDEVFQDADAVVLVTEWPEYRELPWETLATTMRSPFVLDGRNVLDPARLKNGGFRFASLG
jgi:UDPglucose 6-dehydrogenase